MKKSYTTCLGIAAMLLAGTPVYAQVTVDISKITCEQFWLRKIANPEKVAIWLSGFYNGKTGNTVIDTPKLEATVRDITEHCRTNFNQTLMQAAETVMAAKK
jgi:acid stress chaperone HdeB